MEDLDAKLRNNTLAEFQMLVSKISKDREQQVAVNEKLLVIDVLKRRLNELKKRKSMILSGSTPDSCVSSCCEQIVNDAVKVEIMKNARYILSAQKYAGISAEITHPGKVKVLFETSYRGKYLTTFTWELLIRNNLLKTSFHNIPTFVPITVYVKKYNRSLIKLSEMVRGVHIFLMAYTRRREQVIDFVNSCPEFVESLQYSDSYGLIQLKFKIPSEKGDPVIIQLIYNNFCSSLPTLVRYEVSGGNKASIKRAFRTLPIKEAFLTVFNK